MTKEERLKTYDEATDLWGIMAQYDQAVEEMAELIVAINKYKRKVLYSEYKDNQKIIDNLVEEICDVSICLEQLRHFMKDYNIDGTIDKKMEKFKQEIEYVKNLKK